jgi:Flp pilus assembly pilin Flp
MTAKRNRVVTALVALWRDECGLAAVEFCILMGSLGAASAAAGVTLGPVLHPYLLRVVASLEAAQTTLVALRAAAPATPPVP